jgi:hypothetical protein
MTDSAADSAERELAELSRRITDPGKRECLRCYLVRMLDDFGCDNTHRWTARWRDLRAPRATALLHRLAWRGGACCDCEVIFNVCPDYPATDRLLPCAGVTRAGSTQPCQLATPPSQPSRTR